MKKNHLAKNTILLSIGTILNKGLVFFMVPLFSRWLTTGDYGTFDLLCTYVTMIIPIFSLSAGEGIFRLAIDKNEKEKKQIISNGLMIYIMGMLLVLFIILILFFITKRIILFPVYLMLFGEMFNKFLQSYLRAIKKLNIYSFSSIISSIITLIFVTVFVLLLHMGLSGMILGYAFGFILGNIIIMIFTSFFNYVTVKINFKYSKELIMYSIPLIPNSISWWIVNASDRTIINIMIGVAANGIYAIAYKIPNLCSSIFSMFGIAWQEAAIDSKDNEEKEKYYNYIYNKMILILISICIFIMSMNFILFDYVFDIKYQEAHYYVPILVISSIFGAISQFYGGIQISNKNSKANGMSTLVGALSNIAIHLLLIKYIGLYAAAVSTICSTILIVILRKINVAKQLRIKLNYKNYIYIFVCLYFAVCSCLYNKLNIYINLINFIIAAVLFMLINRENISKIIKKFRRRVV